MHFFVSGLHNCGEQFANRRCFYGYTAVRGGNGIFFVSRTHKKPLKGLTLSHFQRFLFYHQKQAQTKGATTGLLRIYDSFQ
jgi:hypothetical protein